MDITKIKEQPLSTLLAAFFECQQCRIVDGHMERGGKFECPTCMKINNGGRIYFHINIHILIDLIQESYHSANVESGVAKLYKGKGAHDISVIIFFCTLRETLLENLIIRLIQAQNLSEGVSDRLFKDNRFYILKQDKLFKSLTNIKWSEAISKLSIENDLDYKEIDKFVSDIAEVRNKFIHEGSKWSIDRDLSTSCIKNLWGLINLYVGLHNTYVHPYYKNL